MDERFLGAEARSDAAGETEPAFSALVEDFALTNGCRDCPRREIYRKFGVCWEVYHEMLENYSGKKAVDSRCPRRA